MSSLVETVEWKPGRGSVLDHQGISCYRFGNLSVLAAGRDEEDGVVPVRVFFGAAEIDYSQPSTTKCAAIVDDWRTSETLRIYSHGMRERGTVLEYTYPARCQYTKGCLGWHQVRVIVDERLSDSFMVEHLQASTAALRRPEFTSRRGYWATIGFLVTMASLVLVAGLLAVVPSLPI